jgi:Na+-driven multidrug efflux pump
MGVGLVGTVALDLLLIPSFEATGAAVASAVAYLAASLALVLFFRRAEHDIGEAHDGERERGVLRTYFWPGSLRARDERGPVAERPS